MCASVCMSKLMASNVKALTALVTSRLFSFFLFSFSFLFLRTSFILTLRKICSTFFSLCCGCGGDDRERWLDLDAYFGMHKHRSCCKQTCARWTKLWSPSLACASCIHKLAEWICIFISCSQTRCSDCAKFTIFYNDKNFLILCMSWCIRCQWERTNSISSGTPGPSTLILSLSILSWEKNGKAGNLKINKSTSR